MSVPKVRERLAARYAVDVTCPLTAGIFVRIAAEPRRQMRVAARRASHRIGAW